MAWEPLGNVLGRWNVLERLRPSWGRLRSVLRSSWWRLGSSWDRLGILLGRLGNVLGASCGVWGSSWERSESFLGRLVNVLEASWSVLAPNFRHTILNAIFEWICVQFCYQKSNSEQRKIIKLSATALVATA